MILLEAICLVILSALLIVLINLECRYYNAYRKVLHNTYQVFSLKNYIYNRKYWLIAISSSLVLLILLFSLLAVQMFNYVLSFKI